MKTIREVYLIDAIRTVNFCLPPLPRNREGTEKFRVRQIFTAPKVIGDRFTPL